MPPSTLEAWMHIFTKIAPLRAYLSSQHAGHFSVGLVPTMGALHEGHLSLIRASKKENPITVCSIYINPAQFGNREDLEKYPRSLASDMSMLKEEDCDVLFCPENTEMYGEQDTIHFDFGSRYRVLEGKFRPGHFSGVALVVSKLFNIVEPDRAYFGQKDYQQFMIVSQLVTSLKFKVKLVCMPIKREEDGLAMSSRNQRLTANGRKNALVLYQCLLLGIEMILQKEPLEAIYKKAEAMCATKSVALEYLALADRHTFTLLDKVVNPEEAIILIAAQVDGVRLIDNLFTK